MICSGARAQVFNTEVKENLRNAPFLFTSRPLVIGIFHAKHISGSSQAIAVKIYSSSTNKHTPRLAEFTGTVHTNISGGVLFNYLQFLNSGLGIPITAPLMRGRVNKHSS